jgi:hypothetical protein
MATRGTILFVTKNNEKKTEKQLGFVYVHHDMYPEGLTFYLRSLEEKKIQGRNLMTRFVRGVERSEITLSHEWHGDTDYRYDVVEYSSEEGAEVTIYKRIWDEEGETSYYAKLQTVKLKDFLLDPPSLCW